MGIPRYGYAGIGFIAFAHLVIGLRVRSVSLWTYPIAWYGYLLMVDGLVYRIRRQSLLMTRSREFLAMLPLGLGFWLIFELYNFQIKNWHYVNYPRETFAKIIGFGISWATVVLIIFETTHLMEALGLFQQVRLAPRVISGSILNTSMAIGAGCLIYPAVSASPYLFGLVWVGFVFLLDPISYRLGGTSLLRDLEKGTAQRALCLMVAGLASGFLWEFWNYWAGAKWVYTVPITANIRIFEMPIAGYLGFIPFALEIYVMYHLARALYDRGVRKMARGPTGRLRAAG